MNDVHAENDALDPQQYALWTPAAGRCIKVGADARSVPLPQVPLPLHHADCCDDPAVDAIGRGVYDYLRQFPDCPHNILYAELLSAAFPHYIADLGAQIAMLDHKEVDAPYVQRKLTSLKILALLDPDNPALLQQIGMTHLELGLMFSQLQHGRRHLLAAMGMLQRSLQLHPDNPSCLNHLAQIDYFFGDYPAATSRWQAVVDLLEEGPTRRALREKIAHLAEQPMPEHPLIDDLEAMGMALELYGNGDVRNALSILERLEEEGIVPTLFPSPEFFYLLGLCRQRTGDAAGAFAAFDSALVLEPGYAPAAAARDRIAEEGRP